MFKKRYHVLILIILLSALATVVQAQGPDNPEEGESQPIRLRVVTFDPLSEGEPDVNPRLGLRASDSNGPYYIVQFTGPVEAVWIRQLEQLGVDLLGYIPDHAHIARIQPEDVEAVRSFYAVRWLGTYRSDYKVAPTLNSALRSATAEVEVYVVAFTGEASAEIEAFLTDLGAIISDSAETDLGASFRVRVLSTALPQIAQNPAISWIEPYYPFEISNDEAREIMNVESIWQSKGFFGEGQIVAVSDTGLSVQGNLNADFAGRLRRAFAPSEMNLISACSSVTTWTDRDGHGTHVSGSVLGSGQNSGSDPANQDYVGSFAGNAPEAELVFMALSGEGGGLECISANGSFIAKGYEEGARISSNSWGNSDNSYGFLSSVVDNYIWQNKDYLVLYAAGNSGPSPNTVGSPGTAKNIISVGASENNRPASGPSSDNPDTVASFSSRGPTADGRIKPDIVAPGTNVVSVRGIETPYTPFPANGAYSAVSGTSMATPLTAGASAVVREWLVKEQNVGSPSAALLKALMIHGAFQLPGASTPNTNSGWGRVDVKNTVQAEYNVFDDRLQGLSTGQTQTYTVTVVGATGTGTLIAGPEVDFSPGAVNTLAIEPLNPGDRGLDALSQREGFILQPLPGFETAAHHGASIRSISGPDKSELPPLSGGLTPPLSSAGLNSPTSVKAFDPNDATTNSFLLNLVGGGDFEDPDWTNIWSDVWLGFGIPVRTSTFAISGNHSMWLGGTPSNDSVWYPLDFPETIASDFDSQLIFNVRMADLDVTFDQFCFAFTDVSGFLIGFDPICTDDGFGFGEGVVTVTLTLLPGEKAELAGQTGYLVFFNDGDGVTPHTSAFIDDIVLNIDFDDPTLTSTPSSGPPGSVFLLTGSNHTPYGGVDVCVDSCPGGYLGTTFADAKGEIAAYLETSTSATPGNYLIEASDANFRTATTTISLMSDTPPTLTIDPTSGEAGTTFSLSGTNFIPNDTNVAVRVNGDFLGNIGSNDAGAVAFNLNTNSNTPLGIYEVEVTDSTNRMATASFEVTEISSGNPTMSVSPTEGAPGTVFVFIGQSFTPAVAVDFSLDGQSLGQLPADGSGNFEVQLTTQETIPPGTYTLLASQGDKQASAQFQITGDDDDDTPQTGNGLYVTLAWTDPPAQTGAAVPLVNNLNLRVEGPGGPYHGNGGNSPDTLNNVETVRIEEPAPGDYRIIVEAASVNSAFGTQPYALVATTAQNFGANETTVDLDDDDDDNDATYLPLIVK